MKLNKAMCRVLQVVWGDYKYKYRLGEKWIDSTPMEKDFVMLVDKKLSIRQKHSLEAQNANHMPGCIKNM